LEAATGLAGSGFIQGGVLQRFIIDLVDAAAKLKQPDLAPGLNGGGNCAAPLLHAAGSTYTFGRFGRRPDLLSNDGSAAFVRAGYRHGTSKRQTSRERARD